MGTWEGCERALKEKGLGKRQVMCCALFGILGMAATVAWAFAGYTTPHCVRSNSNPTAGCLGKVTLPFPSAACICTRITLTLRFCLHHPQGTDPSHCWSCNEVAQRHCSPSNCCKCHQTWHKIPGGIKHSPQVAPAFGTPAPFLRALVEPYCDIDSDAKCMETKPVISPAAIVGGIISAVLCCVCMGACLCVYATEDSQRSPGYAAIAAMDDSEFGLNDDDEVDEKLEL